LTGDRAIRQKVVGTVGWRGKAIIDIGIIGIDFDNQLKNNYSAYPMNCLFWYKNIK
jgi:hypothetical protein